MVVLIRNLQTRTVLNISTLLQNCNTLVEILKVGHMDVNVALVGRSFIKQLNLRYRRRNVETDVLAFPCFENLTPGQLPRQPLLPHEQTLGDIVLGTARIVEDCEVDNKELDQYLPVILTHGLCHLLGYTHETQENLQKMRRREVEVLTAFNKITGYNTSPLTPEILENYRIPQDHLPKPETR